MVPSKWHDDDFELCLLEAHGDNVFSSIESGEARVLFQNAHGISRGQTPAQEVFDTAHEFNANIVGIAEPNCAMTDDFKATMNASAKTQFGSAPLTS